MNYKFDIQDIVKIKKEKLPESIWADYLFRIVAQQKPNPSGYKLAGYFIRVINHDDKKNLFYWEDELEFASPLEAIKCLKQANR